MTTAVVVPAVADAATVPSTVATGLYAKPKPKPTVASVEKELKSLAVQNTELVEKYDQAQVAVGNATKAVTAAQKAEASADASLKTAGVELGRTALVQYEGGTFSTAGALLSSNSGSSYLDQLATLQMISDHSAQVVAAYSQAQTVATAAKAKAVASLAAATKSRDTLAAQRNTVQKQVKKYSALLATLTAAQQKTFESSQNPAATAAQRSLVQQLIPGITSAQVREAITFAMKQVGKPYQWGAAGPNTYDCSGLTMASYAAAGIHLPHSAAEQYNYGTHVSFNDLQPGDLLFFYQPIGHVTMYVGGGMMVSAPETGENVTVIPDTSFGSAYVGATRLISS